MPTMPGCLLDDTSTEDTNTENTHHLDDVRDVVPGGLRPAPTEADRAAWLVDAAPLVARVCGARFPHDRAEDVAQDVLEAVWRAQHRDTTHLDDLTAVRRYAAAVAKVAQPGHVRGLGGRSCSVTTTAVSAVRSPDGEYTGFPESWFADYGPDLDAPARAEAEHRAAAARVHELLGSLTPVQRRVLDASELGTLLVRDVAAALGMSPNVVRSAHSRALERMRVAARVTTAPEPAVRDGAAAQAAEAEARRFAAQHGRLPFASELAELVGVGDSTAGVVVRALEHEGLAERGSRSPARDAALHAARTWAAEHGALPSTAELCTMAGVSEETARQAITAVRVERGDPLPVGDQRGKAPKPSPARDRAHAAALETYAARGRFPTTNELTIAAGVSWRSAAAALAALRLQPLPGRAQDYTHDPAACRDIATIHAASPAARTAAPSRNTAPEESAA